MQFYILLSIICGVALAQNDDLNEDDDAGPVLFLNMEKDIQVDVYTLKNPTEPQAYFKSNWSSIADSDSFYNPKLPVRIFIHGWRSNGDFKDNITTAYFNKSSQNLNLIGINWETASGTINYASASKNVEQVGTYTAELIDYLVKEKLMNLNKLSVVGFSLGAHVAGIAGKKVTCGQIPKITGLDAAKPLFDINKPNERLDAGDAKYVEIIHTNGGRLGFFDPIGMVSFYVNGGLWQPQCGVDITGSCSHRKAYHYYAQSIVSRKPIVGHYCESMEHIKNGTCRPNGKTAILGGEPGAHEQPNGTYYVSLM